MIKTSILNKDIAYSLHNIENFKKNIEPSINEVVYTYYHLIVEYFKFITENIKIRNKPLTQFIITRGLDTITHVFLNLIYFTKNIDLTYFHSQKSFYFYVEFVGQISEEEKMFLQLSSRDAATYVYKKTIFEINNECKKNIVAMSEETKHKLDLISIYINIYNNPFGDNSYQCAGFKKKNGKVNAKPSMLSAKNIDNPRDRCGSNQFLQDWS